MPIAVMVIADAASYRKASLRRRGSGVGISNFAEIRTEHRAGAAGFGWIAQIAGG